MLQRLDYEDRTRKPEQVRAELDAALLVTSWGSPLRDPLGTSVTEPDAPWWWRGDEDASQAFMREMGVS